MAQWKRLTPRLQKRVAAAVAGFEHGDDAHAFGVAGDPNMVRIKLGPFNVFLHTEDQDGVEVYRVLGVS